MKPFLLPSSSSSLCLAPPPLPLSFSYSYLAFCSASDSWEDFQQIFTKVWLRGWMAHVHLYLYIHLN